MADIFYIDRVAKKQEKEKVYGRVFIEALYGEGWLSTLGAVLFLPLFAKIPFLSYLYGVFQKSPLSKYKVNPFIQTFHIDSSEFLDPAESYTCFNDFFIRKLKPEARPISPGHDIAVLPADGRYLFYHDIETNDGFLVKGQKFHLEELLQSATLAEKYARGSMVIARLCPTDYHRFHFPCNCMPEEPKPIKGPLLSVNPLALKKSIRILAQNKRVINTLHTKNFGTILFVEVGATCVGSIHQTFTPGEPYAKGDEKGYFSFGGSSLVLLFEPHRIQFDQDLLEASSKRMEIRGLMGQSMGRAISR